MPLTAQDLTTGVDFTGINPATGADHNNLIELAIPTEDSATEGKGIVICTVDSALNTPVVPNAAAVVKWKRYIWVRIPHATATSTVPIAYAWNDNAANDATLLRWQPVAVDLSAIEAQIAAIVADVAAATATANGATATANAANVNANTANTNASAALAAANGAATNATQALADAAAAQATAGAAQGTASLALGNAATAQTTANNALTTATTALAHALIAQIVEDSTAASPAIAGTIPIDNSIPQIGEGDLIVDVAITPTAASSVLLIDATVNMSNDTNGTFSIVALFKDAELNALAASYATCVNNGDVNTITLHYRVPAVSIATRTYSIRAGASGGTSILNGRAGASFLGGVLISSIRVTELIVP